MHRRQFLPNDRHGFYELLKWRLHARKFAAVQQQALNNAVSYAINGNPETTSYARNREALRAMVHGWPLFSRIRLAIRIFVLRQVASWQRWQQRRRKHRELAQRARAQQVATA